MRNWKGHVTALALVMFQTNAWSVTALGEINIQMSGNIVDFTCVAEGSDSDKTVTLGTWPTKQLSTTGSRTQPMPFTLEADRLSAGCRVDYVFGQSRREQ